VGLGIAALGLTLACNPVLAARAAAPASSCTTAKLTNATTGVQATYATCTVNPSDTNSAITAESAASHYHYSVLNATTTARKNVLVLFLGGSLSDPAGYNSIVNEAGTLGYGAIDLSYPDSPLVGTACSGKNLTDSCFANFRGETVYGQGTTYPGLTTTYDWSGISVNAANSVVSRLVNELVWLKAHSDSWWSQFLVSNGKGYATPSGTYVPDWSKIVIAGHSQGGGDAAFAGLTLPTAVHRVVVFSSPNDNVSGTPAAWVSTASRATPMTSFWGLRAEGESFYGSGTSTDWSVMGGIGAGGSASTGFPIGTGSTYTSPAPNKTLDLSATRSTGYGNHCSTACDTYYPTALPKYWDYLFSGNGTN
jgi:hypothetical protein